MKSRNKKLFIKISFSFTMDDYDDGNKIHKKFSTRT